MKHAGMPWGMWALFASSFKKEFTLSSYEAFLKEEGIEAEVTLIKGRVPCAFALIRRNHETQKL